LAPTVVGANLSVNVVDAPAATVVAAGVVMENSPLSVATEVTARLALPVLLIVKTLSWVEPTAELARLTIASVSMVAVPSETTIMGAGEAVATAVTENAKASALSLVIVTAAVLVPTVVGAKFNVNEVVLPAATVFAGPSLTEKSTPLAATLLMDRATALVFLMVNVEAVGLPITAPASWTVLSALTVVLPCVTENAADEDVVAF
jgi:hypothetical protein